MHVNRSIEIAAPPERVWPLLVEPDSVCRWWVTLKEFRYLSQAPRGPGARVHVVEKAGGPTMKLDFEAAEWTENRTLSLHMVSGSGLKAYDLRWTLEPVGTGSRFTLDEQVELPFGVVGRLIGMVGLRSSESHVTEMLAKLKDLAET